ncbi:flagellar hook-length control protein FliK [Sphingomonas sp. RHCKR7]|uniref:flagellar hook-length control protein FliK n=1 Tax=Sphingomonas folli TaxID=2862497 RepID=UPI001CA4971D|nr:flagellar hook-length control protein FliK [Sphingomonas folli]MBW6525526.1 flagellar hook-length control protein FliK [Sphingomonas folli]
MPVIDVHSATAAGQFPPSRASSDDDGHGSGPFGQLLADELSGDEAPAARAALASRDLRSVDGGASVVDAREAASRLTTQRELDAPSTAGFSAPSDPGTAVAARIDADADATAAAASAPPHATAASPDATIRSRIAPVAAVIGLGSGPVLGAAVTDGTTLVADDDRAAIASDVDRGAPRAGPGDAAETDPAPLTDDTSSTNPDVTGSAALAAMTPIVTISQAERADGLTRAGAGGTESGSLAGPLRPKAHAGRPGTARVEPSPLDAADTTDGVEQGEKTHVAAAGATMPHGVGTHHAGLALSSTAATAFATPVPTGAVVPSASAAASSLARAGGSEADAAALHHLERLYAPHEAASGAMSAFARLGTIGQDTGVALARGVADGRDHVALRLDPPDLGRIDVQLSFGPDGGLRAIVASDNRAALDLLRRDLDQLHRALADAGVRADSQSFHFSERQSGSGQRWDAPVARDQRHAAHAEPASDHPSAGSPPRRLRASGLIDVFA